ncbi:LamG-like jellyroll fold domain-containing protein [Planctomycetota bacterium]
MGRTGHPDIAVDLALGGGWNHVAVTWESETDDLIFYVNGGDSPVFELSGFNTEEYDAVKIGPDFDGESNCFEGLIDNVMIFDRVLSTAEVENLRGTLKPLLSQALPGLGVVTLNCDYTGNDNVLSISATVYDEAGNQTLDQDCYQ